MKISPQNIHNRFQLNGFHFDREGLQQVAYSFVKEGNSYEMEAGRFLMDWLDEKDYVEVNTSGSTGTPRALKIPKQQMVDSALATGDFFGVTVGHSGLMCLPASYIAGKMMFVRAMILGLNVELVTPSSHPLEQTDKTFDFAAMVPLQAVNSIAQLHRVGTLLVGGGKLSLESRELLKKADCNVFETFGMTETVTHFAARNIKTEKFFKTLPGVSISTDNQKHLKVKMPWMDEEITTNDVVDIVSESEFDWLGRADFVVNSGGIKLFPEQIEAKMEKFMLTPFFLAGKPCDQLGERLILVVEGPKVTLSKRLFEDLSEFEKPKEIYFVDHFVRSPSGKIRRTETLKKIQ